MRTKLATLLLVAIQSVGMIQSVSAKGTFHFIGPVEVNIGGVVPPAFAVLELSGDSPYDHTSILSLTFSPAAGERLGYVGEYTGDFDSSLNGIEENSDGILIEKELNPENVVINAFLRDLDPPAFNAGPYSSEINTKFEIQIIRGDDGFSIIGTDRGAGTSVFGRWVRAVPEPTSLVLAACGLLFGIGSRGRNGTF